MSAAMLSIRKLVIYDVRCLMRNALFITIAILFSNISIGEELICKANESQSQANELSMPESEFNYNSYKDSLEYLDSLPSQFMHSEKPERMARNTEIWISYINSLKIVKGYNLKQVALMKPTAANVKAFCNFLKIEGQYAD